MKVKFKEQPSHPPHVFMRQAGYGKIMNREGEVSYARRLSSVDFPRFHVYVQEDADPMTLTIHIDQKAPTYDGFSAHNGEYSGPLIEEELMRLRDLIGVQLVILLNPNERR